MPASLGTLLSLIRWSSYSPQALNIDLVYKSILETLSSQYRFYLGDFAKPPTSVISKSALYS